MEKRLLTPAHATDSYRSGKKNLSTWQHFTAELLAWNSVNIYPMCWSLTFGLLLVAENQPEALTRWVCCVARGRLKLGKSYQQSRGICTQRCSLCLLGLSYLDLQQFLKAVGSLGVVLRCGLHISHLYIRNVVSVSRQTEQLGLASQTEASRSLFLSVLTSPLLPITARVN